MFQRRMTRWTGKAVELSGEDGDKRQVSAFPSGPV